jgi:predicted dehydrogenase
LLRRALDEEGIMVSQATRTVRIGFIGAGGIARQRHLPGLQRVDGVEFVAVANRRRETAEAIAREYGFQTVLDDWRRLIERDDIDAVFIAAPPYLHAEATIAALDADKHVFCQARMARNYEEAKRMYERSLQTDRVTMLCPPPHAMPGDYYVKQLIRDGFLGSVYDVQVRMLTDPYADPNAPLHWRQDSEISGYNTLALGMYCEVLHRWLGWQRRVQAIVKAHIPQRRRADTGQMAEVKIADSLAIASEFENGALAAWHLSGVTRFGAPNMIELYGSNGTLQYNIDTNVIRGAQQGEAGLRELPIPSELRREWLAEAEFIEAIRTGNRDVSPSFTEGIKYIEFTEAVYRSSAEGRAIELPFEPGLVR